MTKEAIQQKVYRSMEQYGNTHKRTLRINRKLDKVVNQEQLEMMKEKDVQRLTKWRDSCKKALNEYGEGQVLKEDVKTLDRAIDSVKKHTTLKATYCLGITTGIAIGTVLWILLIWKTGIIQMGWLK